MDSVTNSSSENDTLCEMDQVARQNSLTATGTSNCGNVRGSYNSVWNNFDIPTHDEKHQLMRWLSPPASRERHQAIRELRADGVGSWLLRTQMFFAWHTLEDRAVEPILFCYGDPGAGKSVISSLVIDTLSSEINEDNVAVTYVYCSFNARSLQSPKAIFASVLRQVVGVLAQTPDEVQQAFERAKRQVDGCGLRLLEILEMLTRCLLSLKRSFICIDALDEIPYRPELWTYLQHIVWNCPNVRLFLTGRPHIRDEVRHYFPGAAKMLLLSPSERDIGIYLKTRLSRDPEPDVMDEELRADILRVIPERTPRIFLLARINMDAILMEATIPKRRQALHRTAKGPGLQDAYSTTLDRIGQQNVVRARLGMKALMWVSWSERRLKSEELLHALGVESGAEHFDTENVPSIRTILECTLGLITIHEEDSTVHLLHLSLQEYLRGSPTLFVSAQSMMAEICLTYINCQSLWEPLRGFDTQLEGAPFLEYATCFWGAHAAREMTEPVKALALRVLDGYENHVSAAILWRKKICGYPGERVEGISGLHCIAFWGISEIAIAMLETNRWDVNGRDSRGDTALAWAVKYGNHKVAELLLARRELEPEVIVAGGHAVFSLAAQWENEGVVKLLLAHRDINPNLPDNRGRKPLSYAAKSGQEGVVKLLRQRANAIPDPSDSNGQSLDTEHELQRTLKPLLEYGNPDSESPKTRDRAVASVLSRDTAGQVVTVPLAAPEGATPNNPPLGALNSRPNMSAPPQEQPLPAKQPPLNRSDSCSVPSTRTSIHLVFPFFLLSITLLLLFYGYQDPDRLFHAISVAWK